MRVFTRSSLLPLCSRASPRCEISLLPGPPAGCSSMNNHAPRVPGAAPVGPALSHGITEEERGATRKRARMCHTRAQSLPSRLHRLWSVSRVAGTSFGPPVSVSLFLSSFLPRCLSPSASSLSFTALSRSDERRINASLSLFSLSNHRRSVRVHSRLLLSQLHRCTSIRDPADFRLHFSVFVCTTYLSALLI